MWFTSRALTLRSLEKPLHTTSAYTTTTTVVWAIVQLRMLHSPICCFSTYAFHPTAATHRVLESPAAPPHPSTHADPPLPHTHAHTLFASMSCCSVASAAAITAAVTDSAVAPGCAAAAAATALSFTAESARLTAVGRLHKTVHVQHDNTTHKRHASSGAGDGCGL